MGPRRAAALFGERQPQASAFHVILFGSLAATGRGHMTDAAIEEALQPRPVTFEWRADEVLPLHPNGMRFTAFEESGGILAEWEVYSPGGGALLEADYTGRER